MAGRLEDIGSRIINHIGDHPRGYAAGAILAVGMTVVTSYAPYDYSGTEPYYQTDNGSVQFYPIIKPNRTLDINLPGPVNFLNHVQAPVVLHPTKNFKENPLAGPGIDTYDDSGPTTVTAFLIGKEEDDDTTQAGEVTCPDGSKVPYISSGPVTPQELQDANCDAAVTDSKEVKKSKEIEQAASKGKAGCDPYEGREKALCFAGLWTEGEVYYGWGEGHDPAAKFNKGCPDPSNPPKLSGRGKNAPHSGPANPANGNLKGNGNPCAVDCSSEVEQAENMTYGISVVPYNVSGLMSSGYMKKIKNEDAQPGDIVTRGTGHIEFVIKHVKGNLFKSRGTRKTGTKASDVTATYTQAWRWVKVD